MSRIPAGLVVLLKVLLASPAWARPDPPVHEPETRRFARGAVVQTSDHASLHELTVPLYVYQASRQHGLADVRVFNAAGDIGGLGVGSDLTWFLSANMAYRMTERSQVYAGYRYIDFDYEDGEGNDRFKFDLAQHGFLVGFRFEF